jgi:hypothetical protein
MATTHLPSRWPVLLIGLALGAVIGAGALWWLDRDTESETESASDQLTTQTVTAESRDLISYEEWAGLLSSGSPATVAASARGTITRTAEIGDVIVAGDLLAEIDGAPVVALYGAVPQFRALSEDVDDGADIRQLEENLVALGHDPDGTVTVDDEFTHNTGLMVTRWEESLGFEEPDDVVDAGQIAFIAGPSEVASTTAVGSQAAQGQPLLTTVTLAESGWISLPVNVAAIDGLSDVGRLLDDNVDLASLTISDQRNALVAVTTEPDDSIEGRYEVEIPLGATIAEVVLDDDIWVEAGRPIYRWELAQGAIELDVDVDSIDTFAVGLPVVVELPDGTLVDAAVETISDVAETVQVGQDSSTVLAVSVEPLEPLDGTFTAGPVTIRTEDTAILGATVVPVRALIAFSEGGHAVDVEGSGLVAVELGTFDDGWVEVTNGTIQPGDNLIAPA